MATFISSSEGETVEKGVEIGGLLRDGDCVALYGDLGSGKTHLVQGICRALGVKEHVVSPTFTIINEYPTSAGTIYHFDFYRVESSAEISDLGFEEYVNGKGICLIEWAGKAAGFLPKSRYDIRMSFGADENSRSISVERLTENVS